MSQSGSADHSNSARESSTSSPPRLSLTPATWSGSPSCECACKRRCRSTTLVASPAFDTAMRIADGLASMVFEIADQPSQSVCSRISSIRIRSDDHPRPRLFVATTFQRSPFLRMYSRLPAPRSALTNSLSSLGVDSIRSTASSKVSFALSRFCAVPITSFVSST